MPSPPDSACDYRIDPDHGVALVRLAGTVTGEDIARYARRLHRDPELRPTFDVIWDNRRVTTLDITPGGLGQMVEAQTEQQVGKDVILSERVEREVVLELYARLVRRRGRPATVCASLEEAVEVVGLDALPERLRW